MRRNHSDRTRRQVSVRPTPPRSSSTYPTSTRVGFFEHLKRGLKFRTVLTTYVRTEHRLDSRTHELKTGLNVLKIPTRRACNQQISFSWIVFHCVIGCFFYFLNKRASCHWLIDSNFFCFWRAANRRRPLFVWSLMWCCSGVLGLSMHLPWGCQRVFQAFSTYKNILFLRSWNAHILKVVWSHFPSSSTPWKPLAIGVCRSSRNHQLGASHQRHI